MIYTIMVKINKLYTTQISQNPKVLILNYNYLDIIKWIKKI